MDPAWPVGLVRQSTTYPLRRPLDPPCRFSERSALPSGAGPGCPPWSSMWSSADLRLHLIEHMSVSLFTGALLKNEAALDLKGQWAPRNPISPGPPCRHHLDPRPAGSLSAPRPLPGPVTAAYHCNPCGHPHMVGLFDWVSARQRRRVLARTSTRGPSVCAEGSEMGAGAGPFVLLIRILASVCSRALVVWAARCALRPSSSLIVARRASLRYTL